MKSSTEFISHVRHVIGERLMLGTDRRRIHVTISKEAHRRLQHASVETRAPIGRLIDLMTNELVPEYPETKNK